MSGSCLLKRLRLTLGTAMSEFDKALDAYGRAVYKAGEHMNVETLKEVERARKVVVAMYETNRCDYDCDGCNPWSEDE